MFTITDLSAQDIWNLEWLSIPALTALHISRGHSTYMHAPHAFINRDNGSNVVKVFAKEKAEHQGSKRQSKQRAEGGHGKLV